MAEQGATTPSGKVLTDEQGTPIRLSGAEATSQVMGFRPERMAREIRKVIRKIRQEEWVEEKELGVGGKPRRVTSVRAKAAWELNRG